VGQWLIPILGHWLIIDLYDPVFDIVRRISVIHVDPSKASIVSEFQRLPPNQHVDIPMGPRRVMKDGRPEFVDHITASKLRDMGASARQIELVQKLGAHSFLCVPIRAQNRTLGVLTWMSSDTNRQYAKNDVPFAVEIGNIAAAHIENSRLFWEVRRGLEMRDHILRMIAHDLRNPLSAIKLNADLLKRKKDQSGVGAPLASRVARSLHSASDRMNELIQDVVSFRETPRATETSLDLTPTDFDDLVERSVNFLYPLSERRKVDIHTNLGTKTEFLLDENKLQSAISLLLENIIFTALPQSSIWITTSQKEHTILLDVFVKGNVVDPPVGGAGIQTGLEIFENHGGTLQFERNEGHFTFKIELPSNLKLSSLKHTNKKSA
jgi:signal transduction histidine kinase